MVAKETEGGVREFGGSQELREHVRRLVDRSDPRRLNPRPRALGGGPLVGGGGRSGGAALREI